MRKSGRLAKAKTYAVSAKFPHAVIIGADQVGVLENKILGKPNNLQNAREHLLQASNKTISFYTGICVYDGETQTEQTHLEKFDVTYRCLTNEMIEKYLQKEQPLECAGACKIEGLGIALIEKLNGKDYSALVGLPLIALTTILEKIHLSPLK